MPRCVRLEWGRKAKPACSATYSRYDFGIVLLFFFGLLNATVGSYVFLFGGFFDLVGYNTAAITTKTLPRWWAINFRSKTGGRKLGNYFHG